MQRFLRLIGKLLKLVSQAELSLSFTGVFRLSFYYFYTWKVWGTGMAGLVHRIGTEVDTTLTDFIRDCRTVIALSKKRFQSSQWK